MCFQYFHKYVQLARRTSVKTEERAIKSIGEHNEILNAIKAKDDGKSRQSGNDPYYACYGEPAYRRRIAKKENIAPFAACLSVLGAGIVQLLCKPLRLDESGDLPAGGTAFACASRCRR